jgi:UDP-2-acetamido-2-deoxy-ribo-hexuluronate aminotransferase
MIIPFFKFQESYKKNKNNYLRLFDKVMSSGTYILGPNVKILEEKLKKFINVKQCISVSNGTDAIEIVLRALGITSGDEVIVPSYSWISTASVIKLVGAKPVFCDIELETYSICPNDLKKKINKKTKAIILVSLYGQISKNINEILRIKKKLKVTLIEDAAQSFGAKLGGYTSCNFADFSTTSFFPTKSLGCFGDGGAIFTNNTRIGNKIKLIRQHGSENKKNFRILGRNARLDELQAAMLIYRLDNFKKNQNYKKKIFQTYIKELAGLKKIILPNDSKENFPSMSLFTIRTNNRNQLINYLKKKNIHSAVYYSYTLNSIKYFKNNEKFKNAIIASKNNISLPISEMHTFKEVKFICKEIKNFYK